MSMSGAGNCYDNAVAESFFSALKSECAPTSLQPMRWHEQQSLNILRFGTIASDYILRLATSAQSILNNNLDINRVY